MAIADQLERWRIELAYLEQDMSAIHMHKALWRTTVDAIAEKVDASTPRVWPNHYTMLYVATQAMAVRRLMRSSKDPISWSRLLAEVDKAGPDITIDALSAAARNQGVSEVIIGVESRWIAENWFDTDGAFRSDLPRADRDELFRESVSVLAMADNQIAHLNPQSGSDVRPTFDDLDQAISLLSDITYRYRRLIRGVDLDPTNIRMESGWTNVFAKPLFKSAW